MASFRPRPRVGKIALLVEALPVLREGFGDTSGLVKGAAKTLAELYESTGRSELAAPYRELAGTD